MKAACRPGAPSLPLKDDLGNVLRSTRGTSGRLPGGRGILPGDAGVDKEGTVVQPRGQHIKRPKGEMAKGALRSHTTQEESSWVHFKMKKQSQQGNGLIQNQVSVNDGD